jgi:hypothetical protein
MCIRNLGLIVIGFHGQAGARAAAVDQVWTELDLLEAASHGGGKLVEVAAARLPMVRLTSDQMPSCGLRSGA